MFNIIIVIIVALFLFGARQDQRKRNTRRRDTSETPLGGFDFGSGAEEFRKWINGEISGKRFKDEPLPQEENMADMEGTYTDEPIQPESQTEYTWGSLGGDDAEGNEFHEYSHRLEQEYTEQGTPGNIAKDMAGQSMEQTAKRGFSRQDSAAGVQQRLLSALEDLPAAIVAAEVLGPPKALRSRGGR